MAKFSSCRFCLVEMERFKLADGTVALVCVACDVIGLEHEMAYGGPFAASRSLSDCAGRQDAAGSVAAAGRGSRTWPMS